jgi:type II secretory pathway pseudopilin PulG
VTNRHTQQRGWALLTILFFSAALAVALLAVSPRPAFESLRDREGDLMFRGKDYQRAIQLYFRKFRRYPARLEELENTNGIRFLRRRWRDPIANSDEWKLLMIGPAGTLTNSALQTPGTGVPAPAGTIGGPAGPGAGLPFGQGGAQPGAGTLPGQSGFPPTGGLPSTVGGTTTGFSGPMPAGTPVGLGGQTFGAGIAGVASKSEKTSIRVYNGRQKYNEWEFVYDFRKDPLMMGQAGAGGTGQTGQPLQPGQMTPGQPGFPGQQFPGQGFPGQPGRPGQPGVGQPGQPTIGVPVRPPNFPPR